MRPWAESANGHVAAAALALLLGLALTQLSRRRDAAAPPTAPSPPEVVSIPEAPEPDVPPRASLLRASALAPAAVPSNAPATPGTNWLQRLLSDDGEALRLPREVIDRWLASGRTNAEDLLAARQAGGGSEFLRMALTNFRSGSSIAAAGKAGFTLRSKASLTAKSAKLSIRCAESDAKAAS